MLENLIAEHHVEAAIFDGQGLDSTDELGVPGLDDVHSHVLAGDMVEKRLVRLDAATDVEDADPQSSGFEPLGL